MSREQYIAESIDAARKVQEFLWGRVAEPGYDFDLWKEVLGKRFRKIEELDLTNHHAVTELRKRLLQTAAVSIAWLEALDKEEKPNQHKPGELPHYQP